MKTDRTPRFRYGGPYKTRERANDAIDDQCNEVFLSMGEDPRVEPHTFMSSREGAKRTVYFVTLPIS